MKRNFLFKNINKIYFKYIKKILLSFLYLTKILCLYLSLFYTKNMINNLVNLFLKNFYYSINSFRLFNFSVKILTIIFQLLMLINLTN